MQPYIVKIRVAIPNGGSDYLVGINTLIPSALFIDLVEHAE